MTKLFFTHTRWLALAIGGTTIAAELALMLVLGSTAHGALPELSATPVQGSDEVPRVEVEFKLIVRSLEVML